MTQVETPAQAGSPAPPPTREEQRSSLVRLVVSLGLLVALAVVSGAFSTFAVIAAFFVMIMLHEFGHFITAKASGMKVTEFFVGFGPRLWSVRKGETEYGVKAIPAGGYCKIVGMHNLEEVDPADEPRTYRQKPYWRRMSVALAGSAMHFLIAFLLLWVLNGFVGIVNWDKPLPKVAELSKISTGQSPAQEAGFRIGDEIVTVDGAKVTGWDELRSYIHDRPDQKITFVVKRDGRQTTLTATPVDLRDVRVDGQPAVKSAEPWGFIGVGPAFEVEKDNALVAVPRSIGDIGRYTSLSVKALGSFFAPSNLHGYTRELTGRPPASTTGSPADDNGTNGGNRFLSPVGFVRVAGQAADAGARPVLLLLVSINIFVGLFNLIPLLPLDGGHVAIATYERIRSIGRRRQYHADVAKLLPLTYGVVMVLLAIAVSSLWLDITKPLSNPFQ